MALFDKRLYSIWKEIMPSVNGSIFEPIYDTINSKIEIVALKVKENFKCPEDLGKDCIIYLNEVVAKDLLKIFKYKVYDANKGHATSCPLCKERVARNLVLTRLKAIYKKNDNIR